MSVRIQRRSCGINDYKKALRKTDQSGLRLLNSFGLMRLCPSRPFFFLVIALALINSMVIARSFHCLDLNPVAAHSLSNFAQFDREARELKKGESIKEKLSGGQSHYYRLPLAKNQYLQLVVNQEAIDVVVVFLAPDGSKLDEVDSFNGANGPEPLSIITPASGEYRLQVRSDNKSAPSGQYTIDIEELRAATERDRNQIRAERFYRDAKRLHMAGTGESLRGAIKIYEEAIAVWRAMGESKPVADTLNNVGFIYYSLGERSKSLTFFTEAASLWQALGNQVEEAESLNNLGVVYDSLGEKQKALDYYNRALVLRRATGHRRGEATTLTTMGLTYDSLGDKQKALEYYNLALPMWRSLNYPSGEATTLNNIAMVYDSLGDKQEALSYFNQALELHRLTKNGRGVATVLNNLGAVSDSMGETQKALEYYAEALRLHKAQGDRGGEALLLNNIGKVYYFLDEKPKALDYYTQSLSIRRAIKDRSGEATTLTNIGLIYDALMEKQKALEHYNLALGLRRAVGDRKGEAATLTTIAMLHHSIGDQQKALDYNGQAMRLWQVTIHRKGEAATLTSRGMVYESLGDNENALGHYDRALSLTRTIGDRSGEALALYRLARLERDKGDLVAAQTRIDAALVILESLRTKIEIQDFRSSYFASVQDYYGLSIDVLIQLHKKHPSKGYAAAALQTSERARARSLIDLLNEARVDIKQSVDSQLLKREQALQRSLNAEAHRQMVLFSGKHTPEQAAAIAKNIEALNSEHQQLKTQIKTSNPRYASVAQPPPLSVDEIQKDLLDPDTLLLEYALGKERSYLWLVSTRAINVYELPPEAEIVAQAQQVHDLLIAHPPGSQTGNRSRSFEDDSQYWRAASRLSQMLIGPVASQLGKKRLLVVAQGILQYVPFAALPEPVGGEAAARGAASGKQGEDKSQHSDSRLPIIINHEVINLPSASTLAAIRRHLAGRKPAPKTVAVLADPVFDKNDERFDMGNKGNTVQRSQRGLAQESDNPPSVDIPPIITRAIDEAGVTRAGLQIPRLPFTREEVSTILALVPDGDRKLALDFDASRATAMSADLANYRIIHFATHGLLNSEHPELSGIVLSLFDRQGVAQDGFLRLNEIYNLSLPAELVILSACQTGLGKQIRGEGLVGLTRGFMYAGAARVVASLWKVGDKPTAELMKRFHQGLLGKDSLRPAAALRAAQISMFKQKRWKSPYYWAAFVMQGEWR